jgi:hypothetical protein
MAKYVDISDGSQPGVSAYTDTGDGSSGSPFNFAQWDADINDEVQETYYIKGWHVIANNFVHTGMAGGYFYGWEVPTNGPWRLYSASKYINLPVFVVSDAILDVAGSTMRLTSRVYFGTTSPASFGPYSGEVLINNTFAKSGTCAQFGNHTEVRGAVFNGIVQGGGTPYTPLSNTASNSPNFDILTNEGDNFTDGGGNIYNQTITPVAWNVVDVRSYDLVPGYGVGAAGCWAAAPIVTPVIESQPADATVALGATGTFGVSASNVDYYNWYSMIGGVTGTFGVTGPNLYILNAQESNQGAYRAVAGNGSGSVTSDPATLTVVTPPYITTQPVSTLANLGQQATFQVALISDPDYSVLYQWSKDGSSMAGATGPNLSVSATSQTVGGYAVHVTNGSNSVDSNMATLGLRTIDLGQGSSEGTVGMPEFGQNGNNMAGGRSGFELPRKGSTSGDQVDNSQSDNPVNELESTVANRIGASHGVRLILGRDQDRF